MVVRYRRAHAVAGRPCVRRGHRTRASDDGERALPSSTTSASCSRPKMASMSAISRMAALRFKSPLEADNPATRSNDGRVHRQRRALDRNHGPQGRKGRGRDLSFSAAASCAGSMPTSASRMRSAFRPMAQPPISPIPAKAILHRVAIDPANGLPTGDPSPLFDHRGGVGGLDGAVVDAEGLIWNARWGGSCVDAYSPEGNRVRTIRVPAKQPSCPVFVGRNFDRLLVTTAWQGMDAAGQGGRSAPWPNLHSRRRRTGAAGTSHQARPAMTGRLAPSRIESS